jgi:Cu(I)/Ag(I) efflux system periplasmic protein CusF
MKKTIALSLLAGLLASGLNVNADTHGSVFTEGEIRKIDSASGRITLRHGPIENLQMPGMTMMFQAEPANQLEGLQAGDKVRFRAEKDNGNFVVTAIEKAE